MSVFPLLPGRESEGWVRGRRALRTVVVGVGLVAVSVVMVGAVDAADGFSDVDSTGVHGPAIDALQREGVLAGTECAEGSFCPSVPVERWVMAVWMVRALDDGAEPDAVPS